MPPSQPLSTRRLFELMRDLQRLATQRADAEQQATQAHEQGLADAAAAREQAVARAESAYNEHKTAVEAEAAARRRELQRSYEAARDGTQQEYHGLRSEAEQDRRRVAEEAQQRHKDDALVILSTFDAQKQEPRRRLEQTLKGLKQHKQTLATIQSETATILGWRKLGPLPAAEKSGGGTEATAATADEVATAVDAARGAAQAVYGHGLSRLLENDTLFGLPAAVAIAGVVAGGFATAWSVAGLAIGGAAGALAAFGALWFGVRPIARRHASDAVAELNNRVADADRLFAAAAQHAEQQSRDEARALIERRDRDLADLGFELSQLMGETHARTGDQMRSAQELFPAKLADMRERHAADIEQIDAELRTKLGEVTASRDERIEAAVAAEREQRQRVEQQRVAATDQLREAWLTGYDGVANALKAIRGRCDRRFPDWQATDYAAWEKPTGVSMGVEFGRTLLDLATVKSGMPEDASLRPAVTRFELPAMITLREQPSMVIRAEGDGRRRAVELMQAVMLRWITGQPPGKVRFTVLDPVGLGEGFNSFMHLADYEEGLIATRIWSEPRDIDEQLVRLTQHMETVIQKYLRSEYESIHEYNEQAGEVAEPFQVLVVNGFPAGFGDDTAQKLVRLVQNGPRCGVYVVLSMDTKQRMPIEFSMDDLLEGAAQLDWLAGEQRFVWRYPAFEKLPLALAEPPSAERMVEVVKQVGRAAKEAVRVEVPFEVVAPEPEAMWTRRCDDELLAPIGRAGANRLQDVRLGKGTSQHLLVAGKTGSGKSTFLHALVTSAAMHYSPDEVEFYLVDFKKGVEFKSYATNKLPHARVIAVESEREFGLSVLQRLDEELSRRGELYRGAGVQSLADYRAMHPKEPMPRVLLVIDEFQELFVEDDKLAQDATLLMDRLVRQGRAFGMHVVLGTQTLAGAYSIARSTLGQIAIRVALACSEADAHLILSDERNTAARFLSRPGEAIYNDQNGLATANELFQVVWLPDRERASRLADVNAHRESQGLHYPAPVVFEGNVAADPASNHRLSQLIGAASGDVVSKAEGGRQKGDADDPLAIPSALRLPPSAFLGDAVAIRPPTAVEFGRHGGSNLLVVGPDDQASLGMLTVGAVSLAAGDPAARCVVLDATRAGDASEGVWNRVAQALPGRMTVTDAAGAAGQIAELAAEVQRREAESDDAAPPVYLIVYNAGRFRDLRRTEDDFSFSMDSDKPKSPDKHLAEVLKSGPGVGVHALVWCDSYNACSRLFDRMALREFALRVVMQMSAADSSNLIDTPAASHLKPHRALFYSDETGEIEKLRPYGPPSDAWLASITAGETVRSAE